MIRANVDVRDQFGRVTQEIRRRSLQGLQAAADTGRTVAEQRAGGVSTFHTIHPHAEGEGFASGIKANNRLTNIFDKGTLGKRTARLKEPGRRESEWEVKRTGANPYIAHRHDTTGKGIAPRNIRSRARAAGRRALLAALRR